MIGLCQQLHWWPPGCRRSASRLASLAASRQSNRTPGRDEIQTGGAGGSLSLSLATILGGFSALRSRLCCQLTTPHATSAAASAQALLGLALAVEVVLAVRREMAVIVLAMRREMAVIVLAVR